MTSEKNVSLALGAGGARGFAHIGVIRELQDRGYTISSVAGTSMGALVGGAFAAGKMDDFSDWATSLNRRDVVMLLDPKRSTPGAIAADKLFKTLKEIIGDHNIEDLEIPYTAVATDIVNQREVWFQSGDLFTAMRASISIPGVFTPIAVNGRILVDGGLMNPVPVEFTALSHASKSVAVSLHGERALPDRTEDKDPGPWRQWLSNAIGDIRDHAEDGSDDGAAADALADAVDDIENAPLADDAGPADTSATAKVKKSGTEATESSDATTDDDSADSSSEDSPVIDQDFVNTLKISDITALSTDASQNLVARLRLAVYPPDVLVTVPVDACRTLEFYRAQEMIDLGRKISAEAFDKDSL